MSVLCPCLMLQAGPMINRVSAVSVGRDVKGSQASVAALHSIAPASFLRSLASAASNAALACTEHPPNCRTAAPALPLVHCMQKASHYTASSFRLGWQLCAPNIAKPGVTRACSTDMQSRCEEALSAKLAHARTRGHLATANRIQLLFEH